MSGLTPEQYVTTAEHLLIAKMVSLSACVMLFYDIMLTFADEVELIWSQKFSLVTVLWHINRYVTPLGYIIIIVSFHDPWSKSVCDRYILFPEAVKIVTSFAIGVVFILRLYAIYQRSMVVVTLGCLLLTAELGVKIWAFTSGTSLLLPPGLVGCILVGKTNLRFACTWIAELVFDSIIFIATLYQALLNNSRTFHEISLFDLVVREGVICFAIIFVTNLATVLLFIFSPEDLKAINASFSTLIMSLMVSRLILSLRSVVRSTYDQNHTFELEPNGLQCVDVLMNNESMAGAALFLELP
ncbi:hypothetical protein AX14_013466 [Amanita brunnescens Koide BX004]|nr:hypothetical protein AX14_013466 [Amanita brunnescens Koide BX004]